MAVTAAKRDRRAAEKVRRELSRIEREAAARLAAWSAEAARRARFLDARRVWELFDDHEQEARQLGVIQELSDICFMAAGRMSDPRMLRVTRRYRRD